MRHYWAWAALRRLIRENGSVAYAVAAEAWAAPEKPGAECASWRPSQDPARQEVLFVVATDGLNGRGQVWRIVRDYKGAVRMLDPLPGQPAGMDGPLMNLLGGDKA